MMAANDQLGVIREFVNSDGEMAAPAQRKRSVGGVREDLGGKFFRSAWEANYARMLTFVQQHRLEMPGDPANRIVAAWEFEPKKITLPTGETFDGAFPFPDRRGVISYTPDFHIIYEDGTDEWHEIKGYMDSKSSSRLKKMRKNYPTVKVILIDPDAYRARTKGFANLIPTWETPAKRNHRSW